MENVDRDLVKDLTLILMYLTSWEEHPTTGLRRQSNPSLPKIRCAWKGYDFGVLDALAEEALLNISNRSWPAVLTEEGAAKACNLLEQYGLDHARENK